MTLNSFFYSLDIDAGNNESHSCDFNFDCINKVESYQCKFNSGFAKNGKIYQGKIHDQIFNKSIKFKSRLQLQLKRDNFF